jgi:hypothetical protein
MCSPFHHTRERGGWGEGNTCSQFHGVWGYLISLLGGSVWPGVSRDANEGKPWKINSRPGLQCLPPVIPHLHLGNFLPYLDSSHLFNSKG